MAVSSQESEGLTSLPNGWDGRTSSTLSATRSVGKSSPTTSPNPNPSTMSKPSTQLRFEDVYESFRVASPASLFHQQDSGPGHPTIDISGRRCLESFERLAPPTSWRRTFAASLVGMKGWFSTRCALTWKVKATKSFRSYFLLQASTPRTAETEFGSWLPTPRAVEFVETPENFAKRNGDRTTNSMPNLSSMAQHVPQMLPTPMARDFNTGYQGTKRKEQGRQENLETIVRNTVLGGKTSQLSPLFVEEMMGFPKGWTASPFQSGEETQ